MRLRLYRLDRDSSQEAKGRPLLIDRFPFSISDPAEWSTTIGNPSGFHECCEISLVGETLFVTDTSPDGSTHINGRSVSVAPILPGDRITLDSTEFLVSYERMTSVPPPPAEFVIPPPARKPDALGSGNSATSSVVVIAEGMIAERVMQPVGGVG